MKETTEGVEEVPVEQTNEAVVLLTADGTFVGANEQACEVHARSRDELIGLDANEAVAKNAVEVGCDLQKVINGETVENTGYLKRGDGDVLAIDCQGELVERGGDEYIKIQFLNYDDAEIVSTSSDVSPGQFEGISEERVQEISENIRVQSPEGPMTLDQIMLDLTVGNSEVSQYKKGALSIYQALQERLQEEKQTNPDSDEVKVIEGVMESAFGLYLRLQRGDAELKGDREGKYSGYYQ